MLKQTSKLLLIGEPAALVTQRSILKEKCCEELISAVMNSSSGLTAAKVEEKVLNTGIEQILFVKTHSGKTGFIADYLQRNLSNKALQIYWIEPTVASPDIAKVKKITEISELIPEAATA